MVAAATVSDAHVAIAAAPNIVAAASAPNVAAAAALNLVAAAAARNVLDYAPNVVFVIPNDDVIEEEED